jgi:ABC-2 type transport system ATP-binding protein
MAPARPRCCGCSPGWPARPAAPLRFWAALRQDPAFLAEIGFLAQEIPLYRRFTAEDHIRIGARMNPRWDASLVCSRLAELRIPLDQRVGTLSGGQRAQVALALTLAGSRVQLYGDVGTLLAEHKVLVGPRKDTAPIERAHQVVQTVATARQSTLLVRLGGPVIDPAYQAADVTLEELVLAYMGACEATAGKHLTTVGEDS